MLIWQNWQKWRKRSIRRKICLAYRNDTNEKPVSMKENKTVRRLPYSLGEHYFLCFFFLDFALNSKSLYLICRFLSTKPLANTKVVIDKTIQVGV